MTSISKTTVVGGLGFFLALLVGCTPFDKAVLDGGAPDGDAASATEGDSHGDVGGAGSGGTSVPGGSGGTTSDGGGAGSSDAQVDPADVGSALDALKSEAGAPDVMAASDVPASVDTAPAGELGGVCGADAACKSGHCVGGICCNSTCLTGCSSCRAVETGAAEGTCAAVKAGLAHANDCATTTTTSCGTDGKCDGKGACRKWIAGTNCGPSSCPKNSSTFTPPSTCDGSGTCKPTPSNSCAAYLCDALNAVCFAACSDGMSCSSDAFCGSKTCLIKKGEGQVCAAGAQCFSGSCGGRCCSPGQTCACTQPSVGNVFANAGIDVDLAGWSVEKGTGDVAKSSADAEDCPYSGAIRMTVMPGDFAQGPRISQCVSVTGGESYNYFVAMKSNGGSATCALDVFPAKGCTGTSTRLTAKQWLNYTWASRYPGPNTFQMRGDSLSARVTCTIDDPPNTGGDFLFDMFTLVPVPAEY
jgi:hypothetical protein